MAGVKAGVKVRVRIIEFEAEGSHEAVAAALGEFTAALASALASPQKTPTAPRKGAAGALKRGRDCEGHDR